MLFAAIRIYPSVNNIIMTKLALVQGEISIKEYVMILKVKPIFKTVGSYEKFEFEDLIKIENSSFKYPNREKILNNINFEIRKMKLLD